MSLEYLQYRNALKNGSATAAPKKAPVAIAKVSEKKKAQLKADKPKRDELQEWFKARVLEMKGKCCNCGEYINKDNYGFAIMTVAHILAKRKGQFPSVATHPDNSLELCVTNGCHNLFDRSWDDAITMPCWPLAVQKFIKIYPSIHPSERKHLPDILRQEVL